MMRLSEKTPCPVCGCQGQEPELLRQRDLAVAHDRQPYPTAEAYEKACAALQDARAEVERLKAETPWLKDLKAGPRGLDLTITGAKSVLGYLADAMAKCLDEEGGPNYVQYDVQAGGRAFVLVLHRAGAKSPHQFRQEAEAAAQRLRAVLEGITTTFEAAITHAERKGRGGQQVPFHGDFGHVPPSTVGSMRWWVREFRAALETHQ